MMKYDRPKLVGMDGLSDKILHYLKRPTNFTRTHMFRMRLGPGSQNSFPKNS